MQVKKKFKICYVLAIIVAISNLIMFVLDYKEGVSNIWKVLDILYFVCSLIALIGFAIFNKKPIEVAIKNKKWFVVLVCLSCVSSLILGYVALLALFDLSSYIKLKKSKEDNTIETTGEVLPTYDEIVSKIKTLDKMKADNVISEQEHNERKQEILDSITKK